MDIIFWGFIYLSALVIAASALVIVVVLLILLVLFFTRVPYVNTPVRYFDSILDNLPLTPDSVVYDLGCGDASFLRAATQKGVKKCIGYEVCPWAFLQGTFKLFMSKNKGVSIRYGDFLKADLSSADIVYIFLVGAVLDKVQIKLKEELKPGSVVVSLGFPLPSWQTEKVIDLSKKLPKSSNIYFYKV